MMEERMYEAIKTSIVDNKTWNYKDLYAVMIIVEWSIVDAIVDIMVDSNCNNSENTAKLDSEERWNYAYWDGNGAIQIAPGIISDKEMENWLLDMGVQDIGEYPDEENEEELLGDDVNGSKEVLLMLKEVVKRLLADEEVKQCIGENTPIFIHDLEYAEGYLETSLEINEGKDIEQYRKWIEEEELM